MTTLRQQFRIAVDHAVHVLRTKPKRYDFQSITIPTKAHPCGCLWGLIGEGAGLERGGSLYDVIYHFRLGDQGSLYDAMRLNGAPGSDTKPDDTMDWHLSAAVAAKYLKRAALSLIWRIPARTEAK